MCNIVNKWIVVIYNQKLQFDASLNAVNIAFALCSVSLSSLSDIESDTIPAPACTKPFLPSVKILLIAIAKSQHPLNEKYPTAPAYEPLDSGSSSSIISWAMKLTFFLIILF